MQRRNFLLKSAAVGGLAIIGPLIPKSIFGQGFPDYPTLLGYGRAVPNATTPNGVVYNDRGYSDFETIRVWARRYAPEVLGEANAPQSVLDGFAKFADKIVKPGFVAKRIDVMEGRVRGLWQRCGGQFAETANKMPSGNVSVHLEPRPFTVYAYGAEYWAMGASTIQDNRTVIRVAVITSPYLQSHSGTPYLIRFQDLFEWEFGTSLQAASPNPPRGVGDEIGGTSPCGGSKLPTAGSPKIFFK